MHLNPILKNVLVRTAYIVGSLVLYFLLFDHPFLFWKECNFNHYTLNGCWQFGLALVIIWFNIRKLAQPIRYGVIGTYLLFFAIIIFWYKVASFPSSFDFIPDNSSFFHHQQTYRILRILGALGFILLASILPIFITTKTSNSVKSWKIWLWGAILLLDFVAAMPNIYFCEQMADRLYIGARKIGDNYTHIYAIGDNDCPVLSVLLPQDSIFTSPKHYLEVYYERHGEFLIQSETQDTIWIEKNGAKLNLTHQTIENNTSCLMRWQWQYYVWHKIKGLFNKEENE